MEFPTLDTNVMVQNSAAKIRRVRHQALRFAGDSRQSRIVHSSSGQSWLLRYESLSGAEANRLRAFFESVPPGGTFSFTDPWTGTTAPTCRFAPTGIVVVATEGNHHTVELELEDAA